MWTTRPASDADLPALRDLCTASVGADDYVLGFLQRFVRESVTLVALDGPRLVGMMVYDDTPDGSVWLHAARTHPEYRRQGVATALNRAAAELACSRQRDSLRLWGDASNTASVLAARRDGFEERGRFTRMRVRASPERPEVPLARVDVEDRWTILASAPFVRSGGGYLFHDFYFLPLTRPNAEWLARERALLAFGPNVVSVSEDFEDLWGKDLQVQLVAGDARAILRAAPGIAAARGADRVESFLPHDPVLLGIAREAGFELMDWGREAILFEKPLRPTPR